MKTIIALLLALVCGIAQAQVAQLQPFMPQGNTITFTANTSGNIPAPIQATTPAGVAGNHQYLITNIGSNVAFISYAGDATTATANCVVPTSASTAVVPVLTLSQFVITTGSNSYFCGITSAGTSVIYVTPGAGS